MPRVSGLDTGEVPPGGTLAAFPACARRLRIRLQRRRRATKALTLYTFVSRPAVVGAGALPPVVASGRTAGGSRRADSYGRRLPLRHACSEIGTRFNPGTLSARWVAGCKTA